MAVTIVIPMSYGFVRDNVGDLILHPSVKLRPVITEDNGNITIEAKYFFTLDNYSFYNIEFSREFIDDPYPSNIVFTGFYSTAQAIIRELQVPDKYVEWVK